MSITQYFLFFLIAHSVFFLTTPVSADSPATLNLKFMNKTGRVFSANEGSLTIPADELILVSIDISAAAGSSISSCEIKADNQSPGYFQHHEKPSIHLSVTRQTDNNFEKMPMRFYSLGSNGGNGMDHCSQRGHLMLIWPRDKKLPVLQELVREQLEVAKAAGVKVTEIADKSDSRAISYLDSFEHHVGWPEGSYRVSVEYDGLPSHAAVKKEVQLTILHSAVAYRHLRHTLGLEKDKKQ